MDLNLKINKFIEILCKFYDIKLKFTIILLNNYDKLRKKLKFIFEKNINIIIEVIIKKKIYNIHIYIINLIFFLIFH